MIREIPQKVEAQSSLDVNKLGGHLALLRRTRTTVFLGCLIAVGTVGLFAPQQAKAASSLEASRSKFSDSSSLSKAREIRQNNPASALDAIESARKIRNELKQTIIQNTQKSALAESGAVVHRVESGETLASIARQYEVPVQTLVQTNGLNDPNDIQEKDVIAVPTAESPSELGDLGSRVMPTNITRLDRPILIASVDDGAVLGTDLPLDSVPHQNIRTSALQDTDLMRVRRSLKAARQDKIKLEEEKLALNSNDSASSAVAVNSGRSGIVPTEPLAKPSLNLIDIPIAARGPVPRLPDLELPSLVSDNYLPNEWQGSGSVRFIWPAKGTFTSGYGWRWGRMHRGIDIAAPTGTTVVSSASGVVTYSQYNDGGYGNLIEVTHPDGSLTLYAHNNRNLVREGEFVSQGQKIAEMGSTGRSTGPHTHFELHTPGQGAINPVQLLGRS